MSTPGRVHSRPNPTQQRGRIVIVLSQASQDPRDAGREDSAAITVSALRARLPVYALPLEDARDELSRAFEIIPRPPTEQPGVWVGYVPTFDYYTAVYNAALAHNIRLLNAPHEHRTVFEFQNAYPHLEGLTPESRIVTTEAECAEAVAQLGLPVFIKGALFSLKDRGWNACVATTLDDAIKLTQSVLQSAAIASRGRAIIRALAPLRKIYIAERDFHAGREFRVFLYRGQVIAHGYYWSYVHAWHALSPSEEEDVLGLARRAAQRMPVPYVGLDIGQQEDGSWIVIESNDPQFCGLGWISPDTIWSKLSQALA